MFPVSKKKNHFSCRLIVLLLVGETFLWKGALSYSYSSARGSRDCRQTTTSSSLYNDGCRDELSSTPIPTLESTRRNVLKSAIARTTGALLLGVSSPALLELESVRAAVDEEAIIAPTVLPTEDTRIYKLKSGIQFRNLRVGGGPLVTEGGGGGDKPTILMHVQALLRDGTILIDTRQGGRPILYQLGSATLEDAPGIVTPGLDDAIVSRGTLLAAGSNSNESLVEPMRQGGIRLVVVPADLAYGSDGLSRYHVWKRGGKMLKRPVPRDEVLRYEIEILRCLEVPLEVQQPQNEQEGDPNIQTVKACCPEELYPCQGPQT